jgi:hypothetical protein
MYHGKPDEQKYEGNTVIYSNYPRLRPSTVELQTDKILFVGDIINYHGYISKIETRVYYPEEDRFTFISQDIYDYEDLKC